MCFNSSISPSVYDHQQQLPFLDLLHELQVADAIYHREWQAFHSIRKQQAAIWISTGMKTSKKRTSSRQIVSEAYLAHPGYVQRMRRRLQRQGRVLNSIFAPPQAASNTPAISGAAPSKTWRFRCFQSPGLQAQKIEVFLHWSVSWPVIKGSIFNRR